MNVEGMYRVYFKKSLSEAKPPFDTCPPEEDSTFDILRFCGSLLSGSAVRFFLRKDSHTYATRNYHRNGHDS